jgi:sugar/nucleoside kinase (ribokinase family)
VTARNQNFSIFGLGTVVVDHQVFLAQFPQADTKCEIIEDRFQVGGPVPTALALLSKWGHFTSFQGTWGQDVYGEMIEKDLRLSRIDLAGSGSFVGKTSGFAHVWIERTTGRRTIACHRGDSIIDPESLDLDAIEKAHGLHLDGWSSKAAIEAARRVKSGGGKVFLDLGSPKPAWEELVSMVDYLNLPEGLLNKLFPRDSLDICAEKLLAMGPLEITVTQGAGGAWHFCEDGGIHQPAFPVEVIDTNGAGDVFNGALIHGTLSGMNPEVKLRFATAVSAIKCQKKGNREALPELKHVEAFLNNAHLIP